MSQLVDIHLDDILASITIPASPAVLSQLNDEIRCPVPNNGFIARMIGKDVGLSALVFKSVSVLLNPGQHPESIREAIDMLGLEMLGTLVTESLRRSVVLTHDASLERFWDSSSHSARICAELSGIIPGTTVERAHTFGLFRDCGIPIMISRFPNYKTILAEANNTVDRSFTAVEDSYLNTNHAAIGYLMTRNWGLPKVISSAVLCHHDYAVLLNDDLSFPQESRVLIAVAALSDHIANQHLRSHDDAEWSKAKDNVCAYLGHSMLEIEDITDDLLYRLDKFANS